MSRPCGSTPRLPAEIARRVVVGKDATVVAAGVHLRGRVVQSAHRTAEDTRNAHVRVEVPNDGDQLHAGDFVEVSLATAGSGLDQIAVPTEAIVQLRGQTVRLPRESRGGVRAGAGQDRRGGAFAILIIIVVFLPLFSLTGLEGKLFKPMALTITFAMAGSLFLTMTLVPVLSALILKPMEEDTRWVVARAKRAFLPILDWALERKRVVIGGAVVLLVISLAAFPFLGKEFMPTLQEGAIMFRVTGIPSTSLEESVRVSQRMNDVLKKSYPQTKSVLATIGRAEKGETTDANYMEVLVDVKPESEWPKRMSMAKLSAAMQETLEEAMPTVVVAATQPIQMRVEELISGVRATLALKVYGPDLDVLDRLGAPIKTDPGGCRVSPIYPWRQTTASRRSS